MNDDDRLTEQLRDLFIFAPIGLALEAKELVPKLADRGRGQVAITRLASKLATDRGQSEIKRIVDQISSMISAVRASQRPDADSVEKEEPHENNDDQRLPIEDYDGLTVPQILPFLAILTAEELNAVFAYEERNRGRITVLNRIRQIQS